MDRSEEDESDGVKTARIGVSSKVKRLLTGDVTPLLSLPPSLLHLPSSLFGGPEFKKPCKVVSGPSIHPETAHPFKLASGPVTLSLSSPIQCSPSCSGTPAPWPYDHKKPKTRATVC